MQVDTQVLTWLLSWKLDKTRHGVSAGRTLACNCSTWKRAWRKSSLNSGDCLQEILDGLVEDAVEMMDGPPRRDAHASSVLLPVDEGELIEGPEQVVFILQVPGFRAEELSVFIEAEELRVRTPQSVVKVKLPGDADQTAFRSSYTNGVLEVRIRKAQ
jgi:hypothetical protein